MKFAVPIVLVFLCACSTLLGGQARQKQKRDYSKLLPPPISAEAKRDLEARLNEARLRYETEPNNPEATIWLGRRLAYLGRFAEAIEVYSAGIKKFPRDARIYRHRGHRYITLRKFDLAIADLQKAASLIKGLPDEVEPDGQPNARNIPTSTLQFNIWYHLGLAQYLKDHYRAALHSYRECFKVSKNDDSIAATSHWLYMTLKRLNRTNDAALSVKRIKHELDVIENDGYYRLVLVYKGLLKPESLLNETLKLQDSGASHSVLYGLANWYFYNGQRDKAFELWQRITASDQWTSFGYIAAEADLKRFRNLRTK
jgi:tetratricopeptide (TPR) repeat protein